MPVEANVIPVLINCSCDSNVTAGVLMAKSPAMTVAAISTPAVLPAVMVRASAVAVALVVAAVAQLTMIAIGIV